MSRDGDHNTNSDEVHHRGSVAKRSASRAQEESRRKNNDEHEHREKNESGNSHG